MSDQKQCDHTKVVLHRVYTAYSFTDRWNCANCDAEFYHSMEPHATLRDQFAMAALDGLLSNPGASGTCLAVATEAYELADAMLIAR